MNTALDSSVIFAIAKNEPSARAWVHRLAEARLVGSLLVCEAVWAETRQFYSSRHSHSAALGALGLRFSPIDEQTATFAGEIHAAYRKAGGKRERLLTDFLIGAHALIQADQLATADDGFLRAYFRGLKILEL